MSINAIPPLADDPIHMAELAAEIAVNRIQGGLAGPDPNPFGDGRNIHFESGWYRYTLEQSLVDLEQIKQALASLRYRLELACMEGTN